MEGEFKKVVEREEKLSKDLVKANSKWKNQVADLERETKNLKNLQSQVQGLGGARVRVWVRVRAKTKSYSIEVLRSMQLVHERIYPSFHFVDN